MSKLCNYETWSRFLTSLLRHEGMPQYRDQLHDLVPVPSKLVLRQDLIVLTSRAPAYQKVELLRLEWLKPLPNIRDHSSWSQAGHEKAAWTLKLLTELQMALSLEENVKQALLRYIPMTRLRSVLRQILGLEQPAVPAVVDPTDWLKYAVRGGGFSANATGGKWTISGSTVASSQTIVSNGITGTNLLGKMSDQIVEEITETLITQNGKPAQ